MEIFHMVACSSILGLYKFEYTKLVEFLWIVYHVFDTHTAVEPRITCSSHKKAGLSLDWTEVFPEFCLPSKGITF